MVYFLVWNEEIKPLTKIHKSFLEQRKNIMGFRSSFYDLKDLNKTALNRRLCLFHGCGGSDRKGRQGRTDETGLARQ